MSIGIVHVEELANEINELHDRIKKNHLDIAEKAVNGSKGLNPELRKELHSRLKMDKFKFSRYVFIGSRLSELRRIEEHLPGGYTLILAIANLSVTDQEAALNAGVINPKMTRSELAAWQAKRAGKEKPNPDEHRTLGSVSVNPKLLSRQALDQACKYLEGAKKYGCEVKLFCEATPNECAAEDKRRTRYIVREAKRRVDAMRRKAFEGKGKLTDAQKERVWGFKWDETYLGANSDEDDAERVLETVGRGDEYQPIFTEALDMYNPGTVQDRKYTLFAAKEDDDESDVGKNIRPALAKAKAHVQLAKKSRKREQKKKKAA